MLRLRITVHITFRQTRIKVTNEFLDVRELLVEIIEPKRRFSWVTMAIGSRWKFIITFAFCLGRNCCCCSLCIPGLFDFESPRKCEQKKLFINTTHIIAQSFFVLPYISALTDSHCSALAASWQIDDALCPWWGAVVDTQRNLCQIQSYICDVVQPMLWEDNHYCKIKISTSNSRPYRKQLTWSYFW